MDLHTRQLSYFSLLILLVTQVIIANIIQNGPSEQKVEFTDTNISNNKTVYNFSEVTKALDANVIAEQYEVHMKQVAQQRSKNKGKSSTSHYHPLETRQNLFDFVDIDLLDMNKDKDNSPQTKRVNNKATDYYVLSPHSSSRSAKNGKHFGESADKDTTGNDKNKFGLPLALMTANVGLNQPKIIINQSLHPKQRPAVNFQVNSENIMFVFQVGSDDDDDEDDESSAGVVTNRRRRSNSIYFLSIAVEKMKCTIIPNENSPKLVIRGGEHELSFCRTIDNSVNNYQSVDYVTSGDKFVTVQGTGDWANENITAFLTASIYFETSNCNNCPDDHFCCGSKHTACSSSKLSVPYLERYRCIPKEDANGRSLLCDGHPNCGFHCNRDERDTFCPPPKDPPAQDGGDTCQGYNCRDIQEDRFLITLILLIVFCVFVPFCIFLFFCTRKDLRRAECGRGRSNGRCPLPLEIIFCPFSISADADDDSHDNTTTGQRSRQRQAMRQNQNRSRGNARRVVRRVVEMNSGGMTPAAGLHNPEFLDDLPPPYSECCNDKIMFPNPPPSKKLPPPPQPPTSTSTHATNLQRERPSTSSDLQLDTISAGIVPTSHSMPLTVASFSAMPTINHVNETSN